MANTKKYIITSLTLGIIAALSALSIGLVNLLTKDTIAQNELNTLNKGLVQLFGENANFSEENEINDPSYNYLLSYYEAKNDDTTIGYAVKTSGSNSYGKISMLVGVQLDLTVSQIYIITNEQTYAQTLRDNYIDTFNEGKTALDDVSCGATYGAKLIRNMANQAIEFTGDLIGK